jgi:cytochrome c1
MASGRLYAGLAVLAVLAVLAAGGLVANHVESRLRLEKRVEALTGGDPHAGRQALGRKPCGRCHQIPGVTGARGKIGPPLTAFAGRVYIAGRLNNNPDNLVRWLLDPQSVDPETAMPPTGLSDRQARDIAAYLYTLQ